MCSILYYVDLSGQIRKMFRLSLPALWSSRFCVCDTRSFLRTGTRSFSWITGQTPVSKKEGYKHFNNNHQQQRSNFMGLALLGAIPTSLAAYYFFHLDRAPFTGRIRMIDMSREREYELGTANFRALLAHQVVLPDTHPASIMVRRVGMRIASASGLEQLPWDFRVVDSPIVNAACLPGGKVVVFTGLLELFEYREDALAVVLAHEAAHALARHSAEQLGFAQLLLWAEFAVNLVFHARFITHWLSTFAGRLPYRLKATCRPPPIIRCPPCPLDASL
jgi:metalloendopeptidase OMA1, mitochondrial